MITTTQKLKRSFDRKVSNAVSPNGKTATIATRSDYLQERLIHVLAQRVSAKVFAMQANWKSYSKV
jgi:hypothetical protein